MSLTSDTAIAIDSHRYRESAADHLWRHFAPALPTDRSDLKVIVKGEGCYLFDSDGNRYLDGLSNLFCVNVGYGYGEELGQAALAQYRELGYHANWGTTHPRAIELAERVAQLAPEGLDHVFFTPSGGESVEAAWKIARQYFLLQGKRKWKAISREQAYHGTTLGALSLAGIREMRTPFEPLVPQVAHVSNTKRIGRPEGETEEQFTAFLLAELEQRILSEDPDTVAMVIVEPVQNHGGMLLPPAGYLTGIRELCDKYDLLAVADETITAFGRVGAWFASERFGFAPDIITTAKGLSSAHAVIGAVIVNDRVHEPFVAEGMMLAHGNTFGGHPVMTAVSLKNLEIMERLDLPQRVLDNEEELGRKLRTLLDLPGVVDVRGIGYFWAVELTTQTPGGQPLSEEQLIELYGPGALAGPIEERGVLLRVSTDGGDPVVCVAPPLVAGSEEFELIVNALRAVLTDIQGAWALL
ncbi:aminotransferase class III-fold pyridoxal phosphate-dependent enzyme [Microbacterium sp.]|uniref:aminotransferase class III-fold pyridoxal phosphate-dependent enzyme n=1 Tax=Microbacterium sp. TaxID=51671 RepID=UPI003C73AB20